MTGLEKIFKSIEENAQTRADEILIQANKAAEEMVAAAKKEADIKCAQIAEQSAVEVKAVLSRGESAALLQEKKIILEAKQQIISNVITKARQSLANLPDSDFTETILAMAKKYAHNKPGKMIFSATDRKRLPKDFDDRLKEVLSGKNMATLTVADEGTDIEGGFLLVYGDIEENCSFDALFTAEKENLQDKVNSLLFE